MAFIYVSFPSNGSSGGGGGGGVTTVNSVSGAVVLQGTTGQINVATAGQNVTFSLPSSLALSGTPTATTATDILDSTTRIATTQFTQAAIAATMATAPLNLTGVSGTVSFASNGVNALLNLTVTSGVITTAAIAFSQGGSGYKVGDLIQPSGGNRDAFLMVTSVSSGAATGLQIIYGGSGYSNGTSGSSVMGVSYAYTFILSGAKAGAVDLLMTNGTYLTQSNQWIVCNNTTDANAVTMHLSNSSDTAIGNGVSIPAGTNNSASIQVQTDGVNDVWLAGTLVPIQADATVFIGQSNGQGAAKSISGDATLTDTGVLTISGPLSPAKTSPATSVISSTNIDWSLSNTFSQTLGASTTFTFSNNASGWSITVALTNTASNYVVTWPGTVKWSGGSQPIQTVGAHTDLWTFIQVGGTVYGSVVQNF